MLPLSLLSHKCSTSEGMRKRRKHFLPKYFLFAGLSLCILCDEYILPHFWIVVNKACKFDKNITDITNFSQSVGGVYADRRGRRSLQGIRGFLSSPCSPIAYTISRTISVPFFFSACRDRRPRRSEKQWFIPRNQYAVLSANSSEPRPGERWRAERDGKGKTTLPPSFVGSSPKRRALCVVPFWYDTTVQPSPSISAYFSP